MPSDTGKRSWKPGACTSRGTEHPSAKQPQQPPLANTSAGPCPEVLPRDAAFLPGSTPPPKAQRCWSQRPSPHAPFAATALLRAPFSKPTNPKWTFRCPSTLLVLTGCSGLPEQSPSSLPPSSSVHPSSPIHTCGLEVARKKRKVHPGRSLLQPARSGAVCSMGWGKVNPGPWRQGNEKSGGDKRKEGGIRKGKRCLGHVGHDLTQADLSEQASGSSLGREMSRPAASPDPARG